MTITSTITFAPRHGPSHVRFQHCLAAHRTVLIAARSGHRDAVGKRSSRRSRTSTTSDRLHRRPRRHGIDVPSRPYPFANDARAVAQNHGTGQASVIRGETPAHSRKRPGPKPNGRNNAPAVGTSGTRWRLPVADSAPTEQDPTCQRRRRQCHVDDRLLSCWRQLSATGRNRSARYARVALPHSNPPATGMRLGPRANAWGGRPRGDPSPVGRGIQARPGAGNQPASFIPNGARLSGRCPPAPCWTEGCHGGPYPIASG